MEALFYEKAGSDVRCILCPHNCRIKNGNAGICGVRENVNGVLFTRIYGECTAFAMDPVEKKPLYHFFPGTRILSAGTKGCNMKCPFCQNFHISQDLKAESRFRTPDEIISTALNSGSIGIAYTYSEPFIWIEYLLDCSKKARGIGLKNVIITNGFVNQEPLAEVLKFADAMNIDLKSFRDDTYKKYMKASLEPVKKTIEAVYKAGCCVELTTLIVTGMNDNLDEMRDAIDFIASIDKDIPWHISRYYPNYKYEQPATDTSFIMRVYEEAVKKLNFVYTGNFDSGASGSDTVCPSCGTLLVSRRGYHTKIEKYLDGKCSVCGYVLCSNCSA